MRKGRALAVILVVGVCLLTSKEIIVTAEEDKLPEIHIINTNS